MNITQRHIQLMLEAGGELAELAKTFKPKTFEELCTIMGENPGKYDTQFAFETEADAAMRKIKLIVKYYNKGQKVDFTNTDQTKWYPYFEYDGGFSLCIVIINFSYSDVPPPCCYLDRDACKEAVITFFEIYKTAYEN